MKINLEPFVFEPFVFEPFVFAWSILMRCNVDNAQFEPSQLIYRDKGYGVNPAKPMSQYVLIVTDDELLSAFSSPFDAFVSQCKKDDESFSDSDIPELKLLGYPVLMDMLSLHRALLAKLIKYYLYFQLLEALTHKNQRSDWRFAINEIADVSDGQGEYLLRGTGYFI